MNKQKFSFQFSSNKKINVLIITLLVSAALVGIVLMIPSVQNVVINLAESVLHRTLRDHGKWQSAMTFFAAVFFLSNPVANFVQRKKTSRFYNFLFTVVPVFFFCGLSILFFRLKAMTSAENLAIFLPLSTVT